MPMKPSILKGVESILGAKKVDSFVNEKQDYLILEDSSGRIRISNNSTMPGFSTTYFVSGIVVAIKGRLDEKSVFIMEDICFFNHGQLTRVNEPSANNLLAGNNKLIAFVSGLQFGLDKGNYTDIGKAGLLRALLLETFQGSINNNQFKHNLFQRIDDIVITGNIVFSPEDAELVEKGSYLKTELNSRVYRILLQNYTEADNYIASLCNCVRVHLMPGENDNSCSFFPQTAINSIMFPNSSIYDSFDLVINPYKFKLDELTCLGTSGQNIDNIKKYSNISNSSLGVLEKTLEWGHISPTAPDTLRTFPFSQEDPLIIKELPDVYFAGNQKCYENEFVEVSGKNIRLLSIPQFCESGTIVLLDTKTLQVEEFKIQVL
jgi:DNA polymerase delta subunit 2